MKRGKARVFQEKTKDEKKFETREAYETKKVKEKNNPGSEN